MGLSTDVMLGITAVSWPAVFGVIVMLLGLVARPFVARPGIRQRQQLVTVHPGDIWESVGDPRHNGLYAVVRANVNTEAGLDSWVMMEVVQKDGRWERAGRVKYMHRLSRLRGEWVRREVAATVYWFVVVADA
jgi:hypothetical protein